MDAALILSDPRAQLGVEGERIAERMLRGLGLKLVARRYHTPAGEIDLVMLDGKTVVFVEVKTQRDRALIDPEERVTRSKQSKLIKAAKFLLVAKSWTERPCRFDVVSVVLPESGEPEIEHFADAFTPARW